MPDEAELLQRAAAGDEAAAGELYDRHGPALLRFLTVTLGDASAAEDVLQETLLYILRTASRYDPAQASLATWMRCVALNLARNELRRRQRRAMVSLDTPIRDGDRLMPISEMLQARQEPREKQEAIAHALGMLNALPKADREVLILRYVDGLPPREIGAVLGISARTASMRLWRALKELQAQVRKDGQDGR